MNLNSWRNYRTAPLSIKLLAWLCIPATLFFIFHTFVQFAYETEINEGRLAIDTWVYELYHFIWWALPFFLFITGTMIAHKKLRILAAISGILFASCYFMNLGNAYEYVDIPHLQYPQSIALLGLFTTWMIHLLRRKKHFSDIFKFIWLFGLCYSFIVPRFVRSGHESGNFYLASLFVFPVMMTIGLIYFSNKNQTHE